jgi:deazaflavin-dependent oxidoreductase (nitroreductase family)
MSNQNFRDCVRILNKHFTNKLLIHISGRKFGHFAILSHTGRRTGKLYHTPIIAEPIDNGFMIALTYGKKVDWLANLMASGSCDLYWKEHDYHLVSPRVVDRESGLMAFPSPLNQVLRKVGIEYFLRLARG